VGAQDTEGLGSPPQQPPRSLRLISSQVAGDEMFLRYAVERRS
jgi:hypothetical protein